jgi:hypothetical protein
MKKFLGLSENTWFAITAIATLVGLFSTIYSIYINRLRHNKLNELEIKEKEDVLQIK